MSWNNPSESALYARPHKRAVSLWQPATRAACSGTVYLLAQKGFWNQLQELPLFAQQASRVLAYLIAGVLLLSCLYQAVTLVVPRRQAEWEKKLSSRQRALLGLPKAPPPTTPGRQAVRDERRGPSFPLGPPQRSPKPITPSTRGQDGFQGDAARSPLTPYSGGSSRRGSPYQSTPTVTTPEQLQRYLDEFDEQTETASPTQQEYDAFAGAYGGRPAFVQQFGAAEQPVQQYRPSLQARGKTGSPLRADVLRPSSQETFKAVLKQLRTDSRTLEVWMDRFREWLAAAVVKPLARKMVSAHQEVASAARHLGWTIELSSLAQPVGSEDKKGLEADEEAQIASMREALLTQLRNPLQDAQRQAVMACFQAVHQYQRVTALLRGDVPKHILPPVPRGYIASRLQQLAVGPCLAEFTWNAGGSWQGKPWTPDLLTDSALIFSLFAAYLEAPGWDFAVDEARQTTTGSPLYIGTLPSRPARHCTALLPIRPPVLPRGATAVIALSLATREPMLTLVLRGEPALTMTGHTAVFAQLLLLLQSCELDNFGAIGNSSLRFLRLDAVMKPIDVLHDLFRCKWFGLW